MSPSTIATYPDKSQGLEHFKEARQKFYTNAALFEKFYISGLVDSWKTRLEYEGFYFYKNGNCEQN